MITYTERLPYTSSPEYDKHFWNAMRGNNGSYAELQKGATTWHLCHAEHRQH